MLVIPAFLKTEAGGSYVQDYKAILDNLLRLSGMKQNTKKEVRGEGRGREKR